MHGVVVLAVDRVDADIAVLSHAELHQGEAPKFGENEFLTQLFEPRRAQLLIDCLVGLAVAFKLNRDLRYSAQPLRHDTREVQVEVRTLVHVIQPHAVTVVDTLRRRDGIHIMLQVEMKQFRHLQHHVRLPFSRLGEHTTLCNTAVACPFIS